MDKAFLEASDTSIGTNFTKFGVLSPSVSSESSGSHEPEIGLFGVFDRPLRLTGFLGPAAAATGWFLGSHPQSASPNIVLGVTFYVQLVYEYVRDVARQWTIMCFSYKFERKVHLAPKVSDDLYKIRPIIQCAPREATY